MWHIYVNVTYFPKKSLCSQQKYSVVEQLILGQLSGYLISMRSVPIPHKKLKPVHCNWTNLYVGDINTDTCPYRLGESQI
jgi:hypothetical protein